MLALSNNLYLNTISFFPDCQELCVKKKLDENLFHQASFYFLICYFIWTAFAGTSFGVTIRIDGNLAILFFFVSYLWFTERWICRDDYIG